MALLTACQSSSTPPRAAVDNTRRDASVTDSGSKPLDAGGHDASGGEASVTRMCTGADDEVRGVNCVPPQRDGGVYGRCLEADEMIEGKVLNASCCEGLHTISTEVPAEQGGCAPTSPPSISYCANCGNGKCEGVENHCNCPEDCPQ